MNNTILKILKTARNNKNYTQKFVAEAIGVKGNTIGNYENGITEPDIDTFVRLCNLYDLNYKTVLDEAYGTSNDDSLSISENELIKKYRLLTDEQQGAVNANINYFIESNKQKNEENINQSENKVG